MSFMQPQMSGFLKSLFYGHSAPFIFLAFFLPIICILACRMIPFAIFIPVVLWCIFKYRRSFMPWREFLASPLLLLGVGMAIWGWCSVGWSIAPESSISTMQRIGSMGIFGLLVLRLAVLHDWGAEDAVRLRKALIGGMAVAALFTLTALVFAGGLPALLNHLFSTGMDFRLILLKQGNLVLAILVWPLVIALLLQGRERVAHIAVVAAILLMVFMPSSTALTAILTGTITYVFCRILQGKKALAFVSACLIGAILVMFIVVPRLNVQEVRAAAPMAAVSLLHRLHIWQFTSEKITERPLLGWGIKASDDIPNAHDGTPLSPKLVKLPLHPHNNLLQSWLELGIVGLMLYLGLASFALWRIHTLAQSAAIKAAAYGTLIAALTGGFAGYGLWQSWWVTANILVLLLVICLLAPHQRKAA